MRRIAKVILGVASGLGLAACVGSAADTAAQEEALDLPPLPSLSSTAAFGEAVGNPAFIHYCGGGLPQPTCADPSAPVQVRWGDPVTPGSPSGLGYVTQPTQPVALSQPFLLGSLTHYNFPIGGGTAASAVQLHLDVKVTPSGGDGTLFDEAISVDLAIDETPNGEPCTYPSTTPCADKIALSSSAARSFSTTVDGFIYQLDVLGFRTTADGTGAPLESFISQEGGSTTGYLIATFSIRCADDDADGACDLEDNCAGVANPGQGDADGDGQGDACDACPLDAANDADADGHCGNVDNCPTVANPGQGDADGDGKGDACDACPLDAANDADADGHCGNVDNCPTVANPGQGDADGDGKGDACDACPLDAANDADGDGHCANLDNCPLVANPGQGDADGDGKGDACDACPLDAANDIDADGLCGNVDNCPTVANPGQADADIDGLGDVCDPDDDNDGVDDGTDTCPGTIAGPVDAAGCSVEQVCPCAAPWKNHGAYVSCVAQETNKMVSQGRITGEEKGQIQSQAGQSSCGKK